MSCHIISYHIILYYIKYINSHHENPGIFCPSEASTEITGSSGEHFTRDGERGVVGDTGDAGEGGRRGDLGEAEVGDSRAWRKCPRKVGKTLETIGEKPEIWSFKMLVELVSHWQYVQKRKLSWTLGMEVFWVVLEVGSADERRLRWEKWMI